MGYSTFINDHFYLINKNSSPNHHLLHKLQPTIHRSYCIKSCINIHPYHLSYTIILNLLFSISNLYWRYIGSILILCSNYPQHTHTYPVYKHIYPSPNTHNSSCSPLIPLHYTPILPTRAIYSIHIHNQ